MRNTRKLLFFAIFVPIVLFKIARITNLTLFMVKFAKVILGPLPSVIGEFQHLWDETPYPKIEWFLQVFDNWYAGCPVLVQCK